MKHEMNCCHGTLRVLIIRSGEYRLAEWLSISVPNSGNFSEST